MTKKCVEWLNNNRNTAPRLVYDLEIVKENFSQFSSAVISADSNTKYKYLVTIMDVLNRNNFETVEINATELK